MQVALHSIGQGTDDSIGGAVLTGTTSYPVLQATVQYMKPSLLLLEQGLETKRMARVLVQPGSLLIFERDELEVVGPLGHEDAGSLFRVVSVERTGFSPNDSRGRFLTLTCERFDRGPGRPTRDTRVGFQ
jgi:hypothetical protein